MRHLVSMLIVKGLEGGGAQEMSGQLGAAGRNHGGMLALLSFLLGCCLESRFLFSFLFEENFFCFPVLFQQIVEWLTSTRDFSSQ